MTIYFTGNQIFFPKLPGTTRRSRPHFGVKGLDKSSGAQGKTFDYS